MSGVLSRLYRGETNYDFLQHRKAWYAGSIAFVLLCLAIIGIRGFNFGIEFSGGTQFQVPAVSLQVADVERVVTEAGIEEAGVGQVVGSGDSRQIVIRTAELTVEEQREVREQLQRQLGVPAEQVSISEVSSSWGGEITRRAFLGLVVSVAAMCLFLAVRFEWQTAVASIACLVQNLVATAGIYSLVGFEVTPSTVIGLLTILGFSLYDNVVIYDKVEENVKGLLGGSRMTYSGAANLAINQTLMRTINTGLIALLPVGALLFVGAGVLGVGTIKDLALVLFIGLTSGAYSSLFLAIPMMADFHEREPKYIALAKRVAARKAAEAKGVPVPTAASAAVRRRARGATKVEGPTAAAGPAAGSGGATTATVVDPTGPEPTEDGADGEAEPAAAPTGGATRVGGSSPRPGARPKRPQQRRGGGGRPSAKKRR